MTPNSIEILPYKEPQNISVSAEQPKAPEKENYGWHIFQTTLSMIGRLCNGIVVGICIAFCYRNEVPFDPTNVHIIFCVIGVSTFFINYNFYNTCPNNRAVFL